MSPSSTSTSKLSHYITSLPLSLAIHIRFTSAPVWRGENESRGEEERRGRTNFFNEVTGTDIDDHVVCIFDLARYIQ